MASASAGDRPADDGPAPEALDADAANDALKQQKADSDAALAAAIKARDSAKTGVGTAEQAVATA